MTSLRLDASVDAVRKRVIYSTTRAIRSKASMDTLVTKARDEATRVTRYFLRVEPPNPPLACGERCSACCSQRVRASVPEVLAVAAHIRANFEPDRIAGIVAQLPLRSPGRHGERCVLLEDDRCSVYHVRPLVCQGHTGIEPADCHRVDHIVWLPQDHNFKAASEAVTAGLGRAGLRREMVEVASALRVALTEPDAERRYVDGEDIFAAARLMTRRRR